MLSAYRRVLWEGEPHDKEHVQPVTTTRGEAHFPTSGPSLGLRSRGSRLRLKSTQGDLG